MLFDARWMQAGIGLPPYWRWKDLTGDGWHQGNLSEHYFPEEIELNGHRQIDFSDPQSYAGLLHLFARWCGGEPELATPEFTVWRTVVEGEITIHAELCGGRWCFLPEMPENANDGTHIPMPGLSEMGEKHWQPTGSYQLGDDTIDMYVLGTILTYIGWDHHVRRERGAPIKPTTLATLQHDDTNDEWLLTAEDIEQIYTARPDGWENDIHIAAIAGIIEQRAAMRAIAEAA
jgi:hypothetical protein